MKSGNNLKLLVTISTNKQKRECKIVYKRMNTQNCKNINQEYTH